mmetsp:Transcript_127945/g.409924  ORF Transcript_127945/g.409924 Transcript_127945/m.409924 type:complete len:282 (-) Transcript_127945:198-1043(-)
MTQIPPDSHQPARAGGRDRPGRRRLVAPVTPAEAPSHSEASYRRHAGGRSGTCLDLLVTGDWSSAPHCAPCVSQVPLPAFRACSGPSSRGDSSADDEHLGQNRCSGPPSAFAPRAVATPCVSLALLCPLEELLCPLDAPPLAHDLLSPELLWGCIGPMPRIHSPRTLAAGDDDADRATSSRASTAISTASSRERIATLVGPIGTGREAATSSSHTAYASTCEGKGWLEHGLPGLGFTPELADMTPCNDVQSQHWSNHPNHARYEAFAATQCNRTFGAVLSM